MAGQRGNMTGERSQTPRYQGYTTGQHSFTTGQQGQTTGHHGFTTGQHRHNTEQGEHRFTTGQQGHTTGHHSSTTGHQSHMSGHHSSTTGPGHHSSTTGPGHHSSTTGPGHHSSTTGPGHHSSTTGHHNSTTGQQAHSTGTHGFTTSHRSPTTAQQGHIGGHVTGQPGLQKGFSDIKITPEITKITGDLAAKIDAYSQVVFAPFNYQHNSSLPGLGAVHASKSGSNNSWKGNDSTYVQLPNSPHFTIGRDTVRAWDIITDQLTNLKELCKKSRSPMEEVMRSVVRKCCSSASETTNFGMLNREDLKTDLVTTIPVIVDWALKLPVLLNGRIPNLHCGDNKTIFLTRKLCCSLLANAFFCTFPENQTSVSRGVGHNMPDFNFIRLYNDTHSERCEVKKEKIKCLLNYFRCCSQMEENELNQIVSFERKCVRTWVNWGQSTQRLVNVLVEGRQNIEEAEGFLQCDFANKVIGGGVLNEGSAMEEIRFCISPELIVSRLFMEAMDDDEAIIITGSQIFSRCTGYSTSFKYHSPYQGRKPSKVDNLGRTLTQVVAMDALSFKQHETDKQFQQKNIDRELHKCYVAFFHGKNFVSPVATGNWGCGVFNGNPEFKFLIQLMAASQQERKRIQYHTMGDQRIEKAIQVMMHLLQQKSVDVGQLYKIITQFNGHQSNGSVFQFVQDNLNGRKGASGGNNQSFKGNWHKGTSTSSHFSNPPGRGSNGQGTRYSGSGNVTSSQGNSSQYGRGYSHKGYGTGK